MATNPLTPRVNNIETGGTWKIGDVKQSFLTEAEFQAEHDSTWVLCDGRDVTGSDYAILKTGDAITPHNIPDARGQFLRGKDHGRHAIDGKGNPDGDLDLGVYTGDAVRNVTGQFNGGPTYSTDNANGIFRETIPPNSTQVSTGRNNSHTYVNIDLSRQVPTAADNRPKNVTCNMFIKINREPSV